MKKINLENFYHGIGSVGDLPIPFETVLNVSALVIVLTFVFLKVSWKESILVITESPTPDGRVPVLAGDPLDPATLRPRALLATAMTRLAACDGFVHGIGGGVYDDAMEGWIRGWLGPEHADALAPKFVATATCRLPLEGPAFDPEGDPTRLHRLRNDPDLGRAESTLRPRLLDAIASAPVASEPRRAAFRELRLAIDAARRSNADELAATAAVVRTQAGRRGAMAIAADRAWAFPLHATTDLDRLSSSIRGAFR